MITPEDRERALAYIPRNSLAGQDRKGVLAGKYDEAKAIQDFAAHRIEALSPPPEAVINARLALANWSKYNEGASEEVYQAEKLASSIRELLAHFEQ